MNTGWDRARRTGASRSHVEVGMNGSMRCFGLSAGTTFLIWGGGVECS